MAAVPIVDDERITTALLVVAAATLFLLMVVGQSLLALGIALLLPIVLAVAARPQRGLLVLVALLPFDGLQQIAGLPDWVDAWKEALVLFTLLCALLAPRRVRAPGHRPWPAWTPAFVGWVSIALASAAWLHDTQALIGVKINFFYVLAALVAWLCPLTRRERDLLVSTLMATGLACSLYGIAQQFQGGNALLDMGYELDTNVVYIGSYLRSFSTFVQPSQFGFFLMAVLLMGLPAALSETRRARNRLFLLALPIYLLGLLSSFSRGAVLGLGIGLVYLGLRRYRVLLAALPLAAVALIVLNVLGGAAVETFRDPTSLGERTTSWAENVDQISDHPLGAGVGRSGAASEKALELEVSGTSFQPDNYYFKTAFELGVLGLWMFLLFLFVAWRSIDTAAARGDPRNASFLDGVAASVLAAAAASLVATYFEIYPMDALFWVLLGIAASTIAEPSRRSDAVVVHERTPIVTPAPLGQQRGRVALSTRRLLMLSSLWPPAVLGGAERYAHALAQHLEQRDWDVRALTMGVEGDDVVASVRPWPYRLDDFEAHSRLTRAAFHVLDVYRPGVGTTIRRAINEFAPDVVHSHSVAGLSTAALMVSSHQGVAHVHTLHDYWLLCRRSSLVASSGAACEPRCFSCRCISGLRNRMIARRPPQVVIAVSRAIARHHDVIPWMAGRVRVTRNPVTRLRMPPRTGRRAEITFAYLGRLTREKGIATLVEAFARSGLGARSRLLVAGEGPLHTELEGRAVPGVELVGWVDGDAKERLLERIDCLVVPSEWPDPAPLVVDEARGRSIPVVGSRAGGIPELIAPADEPLLFVPGDAGALMKSLQRFAADPSRYTDDGEGLTDWDAHLDAVIRAYDDALTLR